MKRIAASMLMISPIAVTFITLSTLLPTSASAEYYMAYSGVPVHVVSRARHYGCYYRHHYRRHYSHYRYREPRAVIYVTPSCCGGSSAFWGYGEPSYSIDSSYLNHFYTESGSDWQNYLGDYNQVRTPQPQTW